jgi:hypothetical protein
MTQGVVSTLVGKLRERLPVKHCRYRAAHVNQPFHGRSRFKKLGYIVEPIHYKTVGDEFPRDNQGICNPGVDKTEEIDIANRDI